ncbi:penicillin acylase family protein [Xanthomonas prunicola]|uniref:Penicillin acylase family protein n=1 Tax=Xanthomonas prunicola TaxID=2053930 RepID=A0A9Q9MUA7_9XANT|nr:penicillin acylase family protein [Xanthomonas prunicola]UXA50938.1 penicillin acylase family protein [Xanthomonas prunicola]UXA51312.1 penicillin acylase family protein [Xanthomonas prunicola]UXA59244.1 penicillin acylase family protein [Xanthomonas prunicola]UXA61385.1 penicillin acylase family protein [Xanthomonas prunicola]UXA67454.1 penicillin acylase family protein [Xanthomonas prunicola]
MVLCLLLISLSRHGNAAPSSSPSQSSMTVVGLEQPAQIRVDHWGVAHSDARPDGDASFVQGFNVARARLFQLVLLRRNRLGLWPTRSGRPTSPRIAPGGREAAAEGSNNWVIAPHESATGHAGLADDPHRAYTVPSLRYFGHLTSPGGDIIGAGEPIAPEIAIGHNRTSAFGLTIFNSDQEDLSSTV